MSSSNVVCCLAVEIHTANCTTDGNLSVTCTHPAVLSNVSLAVDGIVQFSNESNTGVTYFSLPHNSITNSSASCRVNHSSGIHTSVLASLQPRKQLHVYAINYSVPM